LLILADLSDKVLGKTLVSLKKRSIPLVRFDVGELIRSWIV
jgi:hypothetical protein